MLLLVSPIFTPLPETSAVCHAASHLFQLNLILIRRLQEQTDVVSVCNSKSFVLGVEFDLCMMI